MTGNRFIISNVNIILPETITPGSILAENGSILAVEEGTELNAAFPAAWNTDNTTKVINGKGLYLSPGFIDIHNHGRLGCDALDGTEKSMKTIARHQAENGVTGFLAGTSSIPWEKSLKKLGFLAEYCKTEAVKNHNETGSDSAEGARCLGIYSEGSFFSVEKRGAHNPAYLKKSLTKDDLDTLLNTAGSALKIAALSPELSGALEWIRCLKEKGIIIAAAHSNAAYTEAMAGINAGITLATHTFNGMRSLNHQEPGILGAVLDDERVFCELIADGIHLDPVILSLTYKLKGPDHIILVSDSVIANGIPEGRYEYEGRTVIVKDGEVRLENGQLSGSTLSLNRAVRNMVQLGGASLCHAVRAAALNPARILGLEKQKGSIAPGKDADLIIFTENVEIKGVFIGGNCFSLSDDLKS